MNFQKMYNMGNENLNKSKISKIQYGIYVESISDEKSTLYNLPLLTEITKLDLDKFINSVNNVIKNHDVLNSKKALYRIHYRWPIVTEDYIEKSLSALKTLGYFDKNLN